MATAAFFSGGRMSRVLNEIHSSNFRRICLLIAAALLFVLGPASRVVRAQAYMSVPGDRVPIAPDLVELGYFESAQGSLHLEIPLGTFPQRANVKPINYRLAYDSTIWTIKPGPPNPVWSPTGVFSSVGGWYVTPNTNFTPLQSPSQVSWSSGTGSCPTAYNFNWTDDSRTLHSFPISLSWSVCGNLEQGDAFATDSSGYHMYVSAYSSTSVDASVYAPDGTLVYGWGWINYKNRIAKGPVDPNGNFLTSVNSTTVYDTLNRPAISENLFEGGIGVENSQGASSNFGVTVGTQITLKTAFGESGVTECSTSCTMFVISKVTLPDSSTYQFKYDCDSTSGNPACGIPAGQSAYYGMLISMTLPTGGTVTYTYTNVQDNLGNENRLLTTCTSAGGQWQYAYTGGGKGGLYKQTTITKPSGDVTTYQFSIENGAWPDLIQYYNGAASPANLVATIQDLYDFSNSCPLKNCTGPAYIRKTQENVTLTVPAGSITKQTQYTYDSPQTGNATAIKEWNFGNSTGTPDRATYMTYLTTGTNNINRPLSITVCNNSGSDPSCPGGGSKVSQTQYTYDSYGSSGLTSVTGMSNHDDSAFGVSYTTRGNPTQIQHWVSGTNFLTTLLSYDTTGNVTKRTDPAGNVLTYGYTDAFYNDSGTNPPQTYTPTTPTNAYVTSVTLPSVGGANFKESFGYYFGSGKKAVSTDLNNQHTYSHYFDSMDRPTETDLPSGWDKTVYTAATQADVYVGIGDAVPSVQCTSCEHTQVMLDSSGRHSLRTVENNPLGAVNRATTYDSSGRVQSVSHNYTTPSDPNHVFDNVSYDGLDRIIKITHPDGSSTQTLYGTSVSSGGGATSQLCSTSIFGVGYPILTVDEAGKKRQVWKDGFERVIEADEPDSTGALTVGTCYSYDASDQLIKAVQGAQTRTYTYDGLGRPTQETTPEAGIVRLSYTALGGGLCSGDPGVPCSKTAPTPNQQNPAVTITTTYCYDALGRLTSKGYASSELSCPMSAPAVSYAYDQGGAAAFALGRITQVSDSSGSETSSYDKMGNVLSLQKTVGTTTYTTGYSYNAAGGLTQVVYPSGRVVQQSYNAVGQLCEVAPLTTGCGTSTSPYGTGYTYSAAGQVTGFNYGNGVAASFAYSPNRSQLVGLSYTKGTQTLFGLNYFYGYDPTNCLGGTAADNGQINCITDNVDSGRNVNYTYDPLRRLATAATNGSANYSKWGLSESYDHYGNRWTQTVTSGTGPGVSLSFGSGMNLSTTNQPNGYTYDASGNLIVEPVSPPNNYTYDNENRLTGFQGNGGTAAYVYDDNDLRVEKSLQGGTSTVYIFSGSQVIAEYDNGAAPASPSREYIYAAGRLLAKIESGGTQYYHQDHLSVRLMTDSTGNKIGEQGHFPFGESWYQANTTTKWMFTSYERDQDSGNNSGLDYALARFYDSRIASFCSADPVEGDPNDPQSWNRYAYTENDPTNRADPGGKFFGFLAALFQWIAGLFQSAALQFGILGETQIGVVSVQWGTGGIAIGNTIYASDSFLSIPIYATTANSGGLLGSLAGVASGMAPLSGRDQGRFLRAKDKAQRNLNKSKCQEFLRAHGIEPTELQNAIQNQAGWNGPQSTISMYDARTWDPDDANWYKPENIAVLKETPVGRQFDYVNGVQVNAVAESPGTNVYFRPGNLVSSRGGITVANVVHEGIHNLTGWGDKLLAQKLGLPPGSSAKDINPALARHDCVPSE